MGWLTPEEKIMDRTKLEAVLALLEEAENSDNYEALTRRATKKLRALLAEKPQAVQVEGKTTAHWRDLRDTIRGGRGVVLQVNFEHLDGATVNTRFTEDQARNLYTVLRAALNPIIRVKS